MVWPSRGAWKATVGAVCACAPAANRSVAGKTAATARESFFMECMGVLSFLLASVHCRDVEDLRLLHRQVHKGDRAFGHLGNSVIAVELVARTHAVALLAAREEHRQLAVLDRLAEVAVRQRRYGGRRRRSGGRRRGAGEAALRERIARRVRLRAGRLGAFASEGGEIDRQLRLRLLRAHARVDARCRLRHGPRGLLHSRDHGGDEREQRDRNRDAHDVAAREARDSGDALEQVLHGFTIWRVMRSSAWTAPALRLSRLSESWSSERTG